LSTNKIGIRIAALITGIIYLLLVFLAFRFAKRFFVLGFIGNIFIIFSFSNVRKNLLKPGLILLIISNYALAVSNFAEKVIGSLKLGKTFNIFIETIPWLFLLIFLFLIVFENNFRIRKKEKEENY